MQLSRTTILRIIKFAFVILIASIIIFYAVFRTLNYARGPSIQISWPENGTIATSTTITITGIAQRINKITLNGNSISIDEKGFFNQTVIIFPGLNKLTWVAYDQFERSSQATLDIYGIIPLPAIL